MKRIQSGLAIAGLCLIGTAPALAADAPATYDLKEATAATGTLLKRSVIKGDVPFDKRYDQMTPEQRQRIKDRYEAMAPNDEPPFPADGLAPVMKGLLQAASAFHVDGPVEIETTIGPDGAARDVTFIRAPQNAQFKGTMTSLLMSTRYKPAICGGKACVMGFPLQVNVVPDVPTLASP
jgi:hypothetical protein